MVNLLQVYQFGVNLLKVYQFWVFGGQKLTLGKFVTSVPL